MRRTPSNLRQAISLVLVALVVWLPATTALAGAGDIELFSSGGNVPPNILLLIDNSGSMDRDPDGNSCSGSCVSRREIATASITALLNKVNPDDGSGTRTVRARFGLMTYRQNGATVEVAIGDDTTDDVISGVAGLSSRSVGTPIDASLLDAGRYYAGSNQWGTLPVWGTLTDESTLANPIDLACRNSFVIFLTDGEARKDQVVRSGFWDTIGDSDEDDGVDEGDPETDEDEVDDEDIEWGDDISFSMARKDFRTDLDGVQNVVTHMIGFTYDDDSLERIADNGKGKYYPADNAGELATALANATAEVFDSFADFASAVVPTSRTLAGSAFYNAFFEPGKQAFWPGHLEAYRLSPNGTILDNVGNAAVDSTTGALIEPHAPFWDAGKVLALDNSRKIYTTLSNARAEFEKTTTALNTTVLDIDSSDPPSYPNYSASGVTTDSRLRDALIDYLHGQDAFNEDPSTSSTALRDYTLGDIFHSTPRIVSRPTRLYLGEGGYNDFYNANKERDRVIYAGANDGMLHAFDAGTFSSGNDPNTSEVETSGHRYYSTGSGEERFAWVPGALLDTIKMIPINYPRTYYYVDGSPIHAEAWLGDGSGSDVDKSSDEWATVLVTGLREGGNAYLALDVTDPDHVDYPEFLWEFTDAKLGQAWADPIITRVKVQETGEGDKCGAADGDGDCREQWVAILSGGYLPSGNPNSDAWAGPADAGWTEQSRAVFIVALDTGNVLARIDHASHSAMTFSIPSTPGVVDLDLDGFADVLYVGDLGGQVWKWDISAVGVDGNSDGLVDNWPAGVFFNVPAADMGSGEFRYRSFFNPPAVAYDRGVVNVAFGSGEREALRYPGDSTKDDNNRFYVVKDRWPMGPYAFVDESSTARPAITESSLTEVTNIKSDSNLTNNGFYFVGAEGEKFTSDVVIFAGFVLTTSYSPSAADVCTAATGESFLYAFRLQTAYGFYDHGLASAPQSRRKSVGAGLASSPRMSMGMDPSDDRLFVKTSKSKIVPAVPPPRENDGASVIYWRQNY